MKLHYLLATLSSLCHLSWSNGYKMICYYDTSGPDRQGPAKFTSKNMETALQFCSYVIYSHGVIKPETFAVTALSHKQEKEFANMVKFKTTFPNVKFLLSVGGNSKLLETIDFLKLLEADHKAQQSFITSAVEMLRKYKFDGLSLDIPLPTEKPKEVQPYYAEMWSSIKEFFSSNSVKDAKAIEHKRQLTDLIYQLKEALKAQNAMLSLTVLPNVKSRSYFDTKAIAKNLDFIVLSAFDFYTPERNPEQADYMAPIKAPIKAGNRLLQANVDKLVEEWVTTLQVPPQKLILGIAAWGRTWKMANSSNSNGLPPVSATFGPGSAGPETHKPGFLSWPEICLKLSKPNASLRFVNDGTNKYGNYAYRAADSQGNFGLWVSCEDPSTAAIKTEYAKGHNLGGVALFDLTLDDVNGRCSGRTFPILGSIITKLLQ